MSRHQNKTIEICTKKRICFFALLCFIIVFICLLFAPKGLKIDGRILFYFQEEGYTGITVYDCKTKEYENLPVKGDRALFKDIKTLFVEDYTRIKKYDVDTGEETVVYDGVFLNSFHICRNNKLSIAKDNFIFLYDIDNKKEILLCDDNNGDIHAWSEDGEIIYYTDINNMIKALNVETGEEVEICEGRNPTVRKGKIAYKKGMKLNIIDTRTGEEYEYSGNAYSYCFSPEGDTVLVEDEMQMWTAIKNFLTNDIVLGHRILNWDYANNNTQTVIDACLPNIGIICDWTM